MALDEVINQEKEWLAQMDRWISNRGSVIATSGERQEPLEKTSGPNWKHNAKEFKELGLSKSYMIMRWYNCLELIMKLAILSIILFLLPYTM